MQSAASAVRRLEWPLQILLCRHSAMHVITEAPHLRPDTSASTPPSAGPMKDPHRDAACMSRSIVSPSVPTSAGLGFRMSCCCSRAGGRHSGLRQPAGGKWPAARHVEHGLLLVNLRCHSVGRLPHGGDRGEHSCENTSSAVSQHRQRLLAVGWPGTWLVPRHCARFSGVEMSARKSCAPVFCSADPTPVRHRAASSCPKLLDSPHPIMPAGRFYCLTSVCNAAGTPATPQSNIRGQCV